jgi:methionyl-tRNA synthetase
VLPAVAQTDAEADGELRDAAATAADAYHAAMGRHHLDEALAAVISLVRAGNGYAESQAPWSLHKAGDEQRVGEVLAAMGEACRILGHLMAPFTPRAALEMARQLGADAGYDMRAAGGAPLADLLAWGADAAERRVADATPIFPRTELPDELPGPGAAMHDISGTGAAG